MLRWVILQKMEEAGTLEGRDALKAELRRDRAVADKAAMEMAAAEGEPELEEVVDQENASEVQFDTMSRGEEVAEQQTAQDHMNEIPPPPAEKPGLIQRIGRGLGLRR